MALAMVNLLQNCISHVFTVSCSCLEHGLLAWLSSLVAQASNQLASLADTFLATLIIHFASASTHESLHSGYLGYGKSSYFILSN